MSSGAPNWAVKPFEDFIAEIQSEGRLIRLSMKGLAVIQAMPKIVEAVALAHNTVDDLKSQDIITDATAQAEFAKQEMEHGFPLLHRFAALSLWSSLESTVRLFVAQWLQNQPGALEVEALRKLKVRIGDYERLQGDSRFHYIVDQLEQDVAATLKAGVGRFESLLQPFGLAGPVDDEIKRRLLELSNVRNVFLHRASKADGRLIETCPWLGLSVGQQVVVKPEAHVRYVDCAMQYVLEIVCRLGERFGRDMTAHRPAPSASMAPRNSDEGKQDGRTREARGHPS